LPAYILILMTKLRSYLIAILSKFKKRNLRKLKTQSKNIISRVRKRNKQYLMRKIEHIFQSKKIICRNIFKMNLKKFPNLAMTKWKTLKTFKKFYALVTWSFSLWWLAKKQNKLWLNPTFPWKINSKLELNKYSSYFSRKIIAMIISMLQILLRKLYKYNLLMR
jgi:hypothetical protein